MKKRSSIIKFSIVGVILLIGIVLSFVTIPLNSSGMSLKSFVGTIKLGLDLEGGVSAVFVANDTEDADESTLNSRMDGTRLRLEDLLIGKGYTEATVVREGSDRFRVAVPDVDNPEEVFRLIGQPAELIFRSADGQDVLTGKNVLSARMGYDSESAGYAVYLDLDDEGTRKFAEATGESHIGEAISIITRVDGEETVVSSPTINSTITNGQALITVGDQAAAQNLADQITSGQFEVSLEMVDSQTVSATLGEDALMRGLIAGIIGIVLIMAFMIFFYRLNGVLAAGALLIYIVMFLFFLAALPWVQLSLPGIAGILLSIGMAVDGNVIMFERIKAEFRNGKSIKSAAFTGMKKSFAAIFDGNTTTIIASIVLLIFGTGAIRSFALTLLVGVALAMFTNLVVINGFVKWALGLNQNNAKLYNLKRGEAFKDLDADKTDVTIAEAEAAVEAEKAKKKEKKRKREVTEGGVV